MTPDEIAELIEQSELLSRMFAIERSPHFEQHRRLVYRIDGLFDSVNEIAGLWRTDYLAKAVPNAADLDDYAKPIITVAEILRKHRLFTLSQHVYQVAISLVEKYCANNNVDLHRGALFANLAISHLELGQYETALSWLHAAAQQDIAHRAGVTSIYDSYAFSSDGIFGQWLRSRVLTKLPPGVMGFVNTQLGSHYGVPDVEAFCRWLAGGGDLHLIGSLVDYADVTGKHDFHAHSVRLTCIRNLATLFEILLKRIGAVHNDATVATAFQTPPTLAGLICHMHFQDDLKKRRKTPALNANRLPGLFANPLIPTDHLLLAIDTTVDYCAGHGHTCTDVWTHLNGGALYAADPFADEVSKRILLAYKLRNQTSHTFSPTDPAICPHYDDFHLWLLQAILFMYFWVKQNNYAAL